MDRILITNGMIADPEKNELYKSDILIEDGKIIRIGPAGMIMLETDRKDASPDLLCEIINATGCYVSPGLVDVHVHFRDPGFTYKEDIRSGSLAAAAGGVTSVVLMANTKPAVDNEETLAYVISEGAKTDIRVHTCCSVTSGLAGEQLTDIKQLISKGAVGITDDGIPLMDEALLTEAMKRSCELGVPISLHEEDKTLITNNGINEDIARSHFGIGGSPSAAEASLVGRDLEIALSENAIVNIQHISTKEAVELVRAAKKRSAANRVHAEATPHHIALTQEALIQHGTLAKMNPPLRTESDRQAILEGLRDGTIDLIATDHAPHSKDEKDKELTKAPSGITGLETALSICYEELVEKNILTYPQLIQKMALNPARMYGLDAGTISVGSNADLCIFNPCMEWVYDYTYSKSENSPFFGSERRGRVVKTICKGKVIFG